VADLVPEERSSFGGPDADADADADPDADPDADADADAGPDADADPDPDEDPDARIGVMTSPPLPALALLGLGAMGRAMRARLDETASPAAPAPRAWERKLGVHSLAAALTDATIVLVMVSDDHALHDVLAAALPHAAPNTLFVDMGTSGVAAARAAAALLERAGHRFIDAPVSGTVGPARRGELLGFAGGDPRDLARAQPILARLCRRVIATGPIGSGQALKVVLNGLGAHHLVAFASMLALGERAGLARETIVDAFTDGAFASPSYVGKKARVLARRYDTPEFSLRLTKKDARLARELAEETGLDVPSLDAVAAEIDRGVAHGLGEEDLFALEELYRRTDSTR
jgi:3-hydroxyisobutyrate dehydrogenase-like beta-hydroxyacid dehydrogenase